ncbi:hypothetical protein GCM10022222_47880 [Amycolatopsis ultiminotia]|uniref:Uncharacterized protein n=1 Tax=Amycolatopsis ultiminotia TaxID=543629 RepID=A0ABP6X0G6_9PSEU
MIQVTTRHRQFLPDHPGAPEADADTYWSGELEWGEFNFDINPPNYTDGANLQHLGDGCLHVNGALATGKRSREPGKDAGTRDAPEDRSRPGWNDRHHRRQW